MTVYIPRFRRSNGGCMTCKRRRKKCDETKPVCTRCINGDFTCLGYNEPDRVDGPSPNMNPGLIGSESETVLRPMASIGDPYLELLDDMGGLPDHASSARGAMQYGSTWKTARCFTGTPKSIQLDLYTLDHVVPFVVSQYGKLYRHMLYRPGYPRIEEGIRWRAIWSDVTRWAMYLGAQAIQDLSGGRDGQRHVGWIIRFHQRILESTVSTELTISDLDARLAGLHELIMIMFMVSNTIEGYRLFKASASVFLQLVNQIPEVWSNHSSILISASIGCRHFEVGKFVLHDTLAALALDLPPLINYDTTSYWVEQDHNPYLEWLYGVPAGIVVLIAKINAWRVSRTMGESASIQEEWREVEGLLLRWTPTIGRTDESFDSVVRLAVQESWRQAVLIYLYMVMCGVDSTDPYVESAVRQIVKIASTIEQGNPLGPHLFIPCLVAGIAARRESHRATLRGKVLACRNEGILVLRGADFVGVLDHLWHGVAAGGKACMWDDYMRSRCAVLPIGV